MDSCLIRDCYPRMISRGFAWRASDEALRQWRNRGPLGQSVNAMSGLCITFPLLSPLALLIIFLASPRFMHVPLILWIALYLAFANSTSTCVAFRYNWLYRAQPVYVLVLRMMCHTPQLQPVVTQRGCSSPATSSPLPTVQSYLFPHHRAAWRRSSRYLPSCS